MASNEYYNSSHEPPQYRHTPLPPLPGQQSIYKAPSVSPFEAPFDDHVYPAESPRQNRNLGFNEQGDIGRQNSYSNFSQYPGDIPRQNSHSSFGQDTTYYGSGAVKPGSGDDIPLRDNAYGSSIPKIDGGTDHVYDATDATMLPARSSSDRGKKGGWAGKLRGKDGNISWVVYLLTLIQVGVFIGEIARNAALTGSPIEIHPTFNPMIGPSTYVMINMGARFVVCMHNVDGVQNSDTTIDWPCPNTTSTAASDNLCTLQELCGFTSTNPVPNPVVGGSIKDRPQPNQWFRFIIPIFMHAGIIHITFNMLLQLTLGREIELAIGPIRFFIVYMASGIFGFILGGNFAATGIASTGASGALFGILALTFLDLMYTWKTRLTPWKDLAFIGLDVGISFVLGLLPGLDNFSHIGGFLMGLVLGICILHSPAALRERMSSNNEDINYNLVQPARGISDGDHPNAGITGFVQHPKTFFQGRKPLWWAWWLIRAGALAGIFAASILLLNNFYVYQNTCKWCKYLSCLNITVGGTNWCNVGNLDLTSTTTSS